MDASHYIFLAYVGFKSDPPIHDKDNCTYFRMV